MLKSFRVANLVHLHTYMSFILLFSNYFFQGYSFHVTVYFIVKCIVKRVTYFLHIDKSKLGSLLNQTPRHEDVWVYSNYLVQVKT
jgi:hypothetical protein